VYISGMHPMLHSLLCRDYSKQTGVPSVLFSSDIEESILE